MPPPKKTIGDRVKEFKEEGMIQVGQVMMCCYCNCRVEWSKVDTIKKHINNQHHEANKTKALTSGKRQQTFEQCLETSKKRKDEKHTFVLDTVEAMVASNIPLHKVDHPAFQNWLHKYMPGCGDLPKSRTLRESYVPELRTMKFEELKQILKEKAIVVYCDETTDSSGRAVFNILVQTVTDSDKQQLYLASSVVLDVVNSESCANAILGCLNKLEKTIQDVVAVVSDSARYMTKCARILKGLNSDLQHVQCWPHKLHNAANTFQKTLPELNAAVTKVKKVFLHARKRSNEYLLFLQEKYPDDKTKWTLFPIPCITRWNSWKKSVNYLHAHFTDIMEFLEGQQDEDEDDDFDEEEDASKDSKCIKYLKSLTAEEKEKVKVQAEFVSIKWREIEVLIQLLQTNKFPTSHLIYQKIDAIERRFCLLSEGDGYEDLNFLNTLPNTRRNNNKKQLQAAAVKFRTQILKYARTDPARDYLLGLEALLSPRNLGRSALPVDEVKRHLKNIPFAKEIPIHEFVAGWSSLSTMVKEETRKPGFKSINLVDLLCALKGDFPIFASKCLQALWILPSNANSERSIRACNIVVTDLRRRLKPENAETLNIIYFNRNEENNQSYNPFTEGVEEEIDDEELLGLI
ncbi:uncharacterized protein LOC127749561 [Frankliniella occidentalis]|uniref:Uncharacterized protein LOC127749561 n=1 Tax=Frankliniella occidentalis TaxID=133901 RepID=A0A9C6TXI6_FRAOC|nr:uncharacterized protein LOC127749561 [Frankliniella occidentalis]